jgi:SAM-dependent methyltransferase
MSESAAGAGPFFGSDAPHSSQLGYNLGLNMRNALEPFLRLFFRHFYNRFAFTYDLVSLIVSRGEWRAWTRAAIPFVHSPANTSTGVLEIAFGTGNLLIDLTDAGYIPVGVDLSPYMIDITRSKLRKRGLSIPILRAAVQLLPFPAAQFESIVMSFPPGFITDSRAMNEIRRVLAEDGRLIWVDAPHLYPRYAWARLLNWANQLTSGATASGTDGMHVPTHQSRHAEHSLSTLEDLLPRDGWSWRIQRIERPVGYVHVIIGRKLMDELRPGPATEVNHVEDS